VKIAHYATVCSMPRVRNRKELNASLKGTTLGDPDGDTDDTLRWLKKTKKLEKELARKRQEELDNMDKAVQDEYSESKQAFVLLCGCARRRSSEDLVGLKVSHDFGDMDEGDARILTLKDSRILDNEGESRPYLHHVSVSWALKKEDELENVEMAEETQTKRNFELTSKKRDYTGYDDDEFKPGNEGMKRAVLAKYDEDIEGTRDSVSLPWTYSDKGFA
jgi:U4/U6.U5 tri-snRNP-associated protein 1